MMMRRAGLFILGLMICSITLAQAQVAPHKIVTMDFCKQYNIAEFFTTWEETGTDGVMGDNYARIQMHFDTVYRDRKNPTLYHVIGAARHNNRVIPFKGTITINEVIKYDRQYYWVTDTTFPLPPMQPDYNVKSRSYVAFTADYELMEDSTHPFSGIYRGELSFGLHQDKTGKMVDDLYDWQRDSYKNFTYDGTWMEYKTLKSVICCWGDGRLPLPKNIDVGDHEFRMASQYEKNGWQRNANDEYLDNPRYWWRNYRN